MIHLLSTKSRFRSLGRAAAAVAGALLAAGAAFAVSPAALADGPSAFASTVATGLKVKPVRAEIVILVDTSFSMSATQSDLSPDIPSDLHNVLQTLTTQEPDDTVAVIEFSAVSRQIYDGPPEAYVANELPTKPTEVGSDIGAAFNQAIGTLKTDVQRKGVQVASMLLISDGELYAPGGSDYVPYGAPGWSQLRAEMSRLPIKVSGYGLQLPTDKPYDNELPTALSQMFGSPATVAGNTTALIRDLEKPGQQLLDSEIASAAAQDSGKGVQVAWSGLPGSSGSRPLNLTSAGHMDAEVTLTATTRHVPLYLTDLSVESSGLSGSLLGTLSTSHLMLLPGQSVPLKIHLTWQPRPSDVSLTGTPQMKHGELILAGNVFSTYTQTIKNYFSDVSFSTGGLIGARSAPFAVIAPVYDLLFIPIILASLLVAFGIFAFFRLRVRLAGTFTLTSADDSSGVIPLSEWRWRRFVSTDEIIGIRGRMAVRGQLHGNKMKIGLQLENRPGSELKLVPGGRTMIAGIDIVHEMDSVGPATGSGWQ